MSVDINIETSGSSGSSGGGGGGGDRGGDGSSPNKIARLSKGAQAVNTKQLNKDRKLAQQRVTAMANMLRTIVKVPTTLRIGGPLAALRGPLQLIVNYPSRFGLVGPSLNDYSDSGNDTG